MTTLNYIGLAGQGIFGITMMIVLMISFIEHNWKWFTLLGLIILLFLGSSAIAIH